MVNNFSAKKKKGFTLIELIVVMAIIAILAAVTVPTSMHFIEKANDSNRNSFMQQFGDICYQRWVDADARNRVVTAKQLIDEIVPENAELFENVTAIPVYSGVQYNTDSENVIFGEPTASSASDSNYVTGGITQAEINFNKSTFLANECITVFFGKYESKYQLVLRYYINGKAKEEIKRVVYLRPLKTGE